MKVRQLVADDFHVYIAIAPSLNYLTLILRLCSIRWVFSFLFVFHGIFYYIQNFFNVSKKWV
jgi:hypothetical protein